MQGKQAVLGYIPRGRLPDTTHRRLLMLRQCDSITSRKHQSANRPTLKLNNTSVVAVDRSIGTRSRGGCRCSRVAAITGAQLSVQVTSTREHSGLMECINKTSTVNSDLRYSALQPWQAVNVHVEYQQISTDQY